MRSIRLCVREASRGARLRCDAPASPARPAPGSGNTSAGSRTGFPAVRARDRRWDRDGGGRRKARRRTAVRVGLIGCPGGSCARSLFNHSGAVSGEHDVTPPSRRLSRGRLAHAEGGTPSGQPARCRRYSHELPVQQKRLVRCLLGRYDHPPGSPLLESSAYGISRLGDHETKGVIWKILSHKELQLLVDNI